MDQNTLNMPPQTPRGGGAGPIIALILILLAVIVGAIYFWRNRGADNAANQPESASDAEASIEADLNSTNIDSVDVEYDLNEENFNAS